MVTIYKLINNFNFYRESQNPWMSISIKCEFREILFSAQLSQIHGDTKVLSTFQVPSYRSISSKLINQSGHVPTFNFIYKIIMYLPMSYIIYYIFIGENVFYGILQNVKFYSPRYYFSGIYGAPSYLWKSTFY